MALRCGVVLSDAVPIEASGWQARDGRLVAHLEVGESNSAVSLHGEPSELRRLARGALVAAERAERGPVDLMTDEAG